MRNLFWPLLLLAAFGLSACAHKKTAGTNYPPMAGTPTAPSASPNEGLSGKISAANPNLKFVVLTFPLGQMAHNNQHLGVYRSGLKVGELNVSGPQRDDSTVADVIEGDAQVGDEVLDR